MKEIKERQETEDYKKKVDGQSSKRLLEYMRSENLLNSEPPAEKNTNE